MTTFLHRFNFRRAVATAILFLSSVPAVQAQEAASCTASPTSMTPSGWSVSPKPAVQVTPKDSSPLALISDIPLPGPAKRFDYQSFDSISGSRIDA